jgi:hypothetical protein
VIAFLFKFANDDDEPLKGLFALLIASAVAGLIAAGLCLLNIYLELRSYRLHLKYRYERKQWDDLTQMEQDDWTAINKRAAIVLNLAFLFLFTEIGIAVVFGCLKFLFN